MKEKQTALYLALLNKNEEILNLLLRNKNIHLNEYNLIGLNDYNRKITALHLCVEKGYLDIAKQLLSFDSIDVNIPCIYKSKDKKYKKTALFMAAENNDIEMVRLLLSCNKTNVNIINKETFYSYKYKSDIRYKCLKCKKTSLFRAIELGSIDIVKLLLSNNQFDVNIINSIISKDSEFNTNDKMERTALHTDAS